MFQYVYMYNITKRYKIPRLFNYALSKILVSSTLVSSTCLDLHAENFSRMSRNPANKFTGENSLNRTTCSFMRNPARAVSKIRRTIKPLFVCYPTWRLHLPHVCAFVLHTSSHALHRRIMSPFMPRTCAEQLHFKITDFAARFVRKHARDKSPYLTLRVDDDDANPKFLCGPPYVSIPLPLPSLLSFPLFLLII